MAYTYTWIDAEQTTLLREDADGNVSFVPADEENVDYAEFVGSATTAAAYVEPPAAAPSQLELLATRVAAIESDEISDDASSSALLTLIADLTTRVTTLEGA